VIDPLLTATISVATPFSLNDEGEFAYGSPVVVACKVEHKQEQVKNAEGQMVLSDHWIVTKTSIGPQDRIWLPGQDSGDATLARTPQTISSATGVGSGDTLYEVRL
jgi:hypothetical protein